MSHWEYWLNIAFVLLFVTAYIDTGGEEVLWLFAATFQLIHTKANQILAEVKKGQR